MTKHPMDLIGWLRYHRDELGVRRFDSSCAGLGGMFGAAPPEPVASLVARFLRSCALSLEDRAPRRPFCILVPRQTFTRLPSAREERIDRPADEQIEN